MSTLFNKSMQILNYLTEAGSSCGVTQLAKDLGMPKSSASRLLSMLYKHDLVARTRAGKYHLGPGTLTWAHNYTHRSELISICQPYMEHLGRLTDQSICLFSYGENFKLYQVHSLLVRNSTRQALPHNGSIVPLSCTAAGKAVLMSIDPDTLARFFAEKELPHLTTHSITTEAALRNQLKFFSSRGYTEDDEECMPEVCAVAAPLLKEPLHPVAAIAVFSSSYRNSRQEMARAGMLVAEICQDIQKQFAKKKK